MHELTKIYEVMDRRAAGVRSAGGRADICVMFDGPSCCGGLEIYGADNVRKLTPLLTRDEQVKEFFGMPYISVLPRRANAFNTMLSNYWTVALISLGGDSVYYCAATIPGKGMTPPPPAPIKSDDDDLAAMLGITETTDDMDLL